MSRRAHCGELQTVGRGLIILWMLTVLPATASASESARQVVKNAIAVLSVHRDLRGLKSIQSSVQSISYDIVENDHPDAPWYVTLDKSRVTDDLSGTRSLTETETPGTGDAPARDVRVLLTPAIWQRRVVQAGKPDVVQGRRALPSWETQNPLRALLMAEASADLKMEKPAVLHGHLQEVVSFLNGKYPVRIYSDALTHLPAAVEATVAFTGTDSADVAWNAWGDVKERVEYMNWNLVEGIRYPFQRDVFRNDQLFHTITISEAHLEVPIQEADFTIAPKAEQDVAATAGLTVDTLPLGHPLTRAPAPNLPMAEIAPGVVQIPNSWYVTLVHQEDGVVVIDAPISAGYSKEVLDEAARRFPGLPVKAVISSTGYFWHIAGLREYAARGIPIYLRDRNEPLVRRMLAAPHTLVPDDLSRSPRRAILHAVSGRTVIGTGANMLVVMPITRASADMLMTYLPSAKILHTAEMVQPLGPNGSLLYPEALLEVQESAQAAGFTVDRMIGMHMSPTPWSALDDALRAAGE